MIKGNNRPTNVLAAFLCGIAIFIAPLGVFAQTQITPPKNKYSPNDDVKLGRQAAAQAEQQLPILRDAQVTDYVASVGQRLAGAIPPEFQHPEFQYTFKVVDASDINAFALPGGPMYVNRGMIQAARNEGEMAGVMAHEMSHVALRHGTAQATKAQKYEYGALAGAILGAVIGGPIGSVVGQGTQFGVGAAFLRFSREYEREADILGSHIMARAGYDPRDLANVFRTIEQQSGGRGGPQWLSDHPNPGNRFAYINNEAAHLQVSPNPIKITREFRRIQERLGGMPRARSTEEIQRTGQRNPNNGRNYPNNSGNYPGTASGRVDYPSGNYRNYTEGNLFQVSVPDNWQEINGGDSNSVWFAPNGAYGQSNGQAVFTHGVNIGVTRNESHNLQQATDEFINSFTQGNRNMRRLSGSQRSDIAGRYALVNTLRNINEATGQPETVAVYTAAMNDGNLFYIISVAPQNGYGRYQGAFQNIVRSVRIND